MARAGEDVEKGKPRAVLVERQTGATAVGNWTEGPQETKEGYSDPAVPLPGVCSQAMKQDREEIHARPRSAQRHSQEPRHGNSPSVHHQTTR